MGMDLIGYMVKGPRNLDPVMREGAAALVKQKLDELQALLEKVGYGSEEAVEYDFREVFAEYPWAYDEEDLAALAESSPEAIVNNLYELWVHGARDTSSRLDPDDKHSIIMFAGAGTWGDEPEGFGYQTLRDADRVPGLFSILNIR